MSSNKNTNKRIKIADNLSTPTEQQEQSNIFISAGVEESKGEETVQEPIGNDSQGTIRDISHGNMSDISLSPFGLGIMTHGTPMPSNDLSLISSDVPVDMGLFTNMIKSNKK